MKNKKSYTLMELVIYTSLVGVIIYLTSNFITVFNKMYDNMKKVDDFQTSYKNFIYDINGYFFQGATGSINSTGIIINHNNNYFGYDCKNKGILKTQKENTKNNIDRTTGNLYDGFKCFSFDLRDEKYGYYLDTKVNYLSYEPINFTHFLY